MKSIIFLNLVQECIQDESKLTIFFFVRLSLKKQRGYAQTSFNKPQKMVFPGLSNKKRRITDEKELRHKHVCTVQIIF